MGLTPHRSEAASRPRRGGPPSIWERVPRLEEICVWSALFRSHRSITPRGNTMDRNIRRFAALVFVLFGCDASHTVSATDYNLSCVTASDCLPIYQGALGCCGFITTCPNAAINRADSAKYMNDVMTRTPSCSPPRPCGSVTNCGTPPAECPNSLCVLPSQGDAAAD